MTVSIVLAVLTVVALIVCVLVKPYIKIGKVTIGLYWVVCLVGAILQLAFGTIPFDKVVAGITADTSVNPLKILALFISMTLISIFLGDAGFFDWVADKVFMKAKGKQISLFLILYAVVAFLTIFTSNDIIILTFTPPICIFAKKQKISPLPYLFGEFIAANTFSLFLIVGNPTNIYLATSYGITFFDYFLKMVLPATVCGLSALGTTLLVFRKQLMGSLQGATDWTGSNAINLTEAYEREPAHVKKVPMFVALGHLVVCIILLAISNYIGVEMYLICVCIFGSLLIFNVIYELATSKKLTSTFKTLTRAPFELIPFVISMFIIVLALAHNGVTEVIGNALITGEKTDGMVFGLLSALGSNFLNNIPMSVLFEKIVSGTSLYSILGTVIGSNVGAIITPLGALAGIMWTKILKKQGIRLPFHKFVMYGAPIALVSLLLSCLCLFAI